MSLQITTIKSLQVDPSVRFDPSRKHRDWQTYHVLVRHVAYNFILNGLKRKISSKLLIFEKVHFHLPNY